MDERRVGRRDDRRVGASAERPAAGGDALERAAARRRVLGALRPRRQADARRPADDDHRVGDPGDDPGHPLEQRHAVPVELRPWAIPSSSSRRRRGRSRPAGPSLGPPAGRQLPPSAAQRADVPGPPGVALLVQGLEDRLGVLAGHARAGRAAVRASGRRALPPAQRRPAPPRRTARPRTPDRRRRGRSRRPRRGARPARDRPARAMPGSVPRRAAGPAAPRRRPPTARRGRRAPQPSGAAGRACPLRVGIGSVTRPPATVVRGAVSRMITRSPASAATGDESRSWMSPRGAGRHLVRAPHRHRCRDLGRAVVHRHALAVAESPRRRRRAPRPGTPGGRSGAARRAWPGSSPAAPRCARCRPGRRPRAARRTPARPARSCTCTLRTRACGPPGSTRQPGLRLDRARPERAGDDRADAPQRERAVDRQPHRPLGGPRADARRHGVQRGAQLVDPGAVARRHLDHRHVADQLGDLHAHDLHGLVVHQVALGQRDHAALQAQQPDDRQVLPGLGHDAVVQRDHQQEQIDARGARDHRADEALVAGDVHDGQPAAGRQLERRVAELDRDAAALLLRQPVGVDAGQRRAPARSCRGRCARRCRASEADQIAFAGGQGAAVEQHAALLDPGHHRRVELAQPRRQSVAAVQRAGVRRQLEQRQRAAAHPGDRLDDPAAQPLRQPLGARPAPRRRAPRPSAARAPTARRSAGRGTAPASPPAQPARACPAASPAPAGGGGRARRTRPARRRCPPAGRPAACRRRSRRAPRRPRCSTSPSARPPGRAGRPGRPTRDRRSPARRAGCRSPPVRSATAGR